jgi:hypothetical protein
VTFDFTGRSAATLAAGLLHKMIEAPGTQADPQAAPLALRGRALRPALTAAERQVLAALPDPAQLRRLALARRSNETTLPQHLAQLKAKLFVGEAAPPENERLVARAVDLGLIDPSAPGVARALAFCAAQSALPQLNPALYDLLLALDQLPPARAARRLQISAQGLEVRLARDLPAALGTTLLGAHTAQHKARRLLQAAARHGVVPGERQDDDRWWCSADSAMAQAAAASGFGGEPPPQHPPAVQALPNPSQVEYAQRLVNDQIAMADTAARLERQRRYERAKNTPVVVRRKPLVP